MQKLFIRSSKERLGFPSFPYYGSQRRQEEPKGTYCRATLRSFLFSASRLIVSFHIIRRKDPPLAVIWGCKQLAAGHIT